MSRVGGKLVALFVDFKAAFNSGQRDIDKCDEKKVREGLIIVEVFVEMINRKLGKCAW